MVMSLWEEAGNGGDVRMGKIMLDVFMWVIAAGVVQSTPDSRP